MQNTTVQNTSNAIAASAQIAPTAVIGNNVEIGENTVISDYVVIRDNVSIGANCKIYSHSVIGEDPQDFSYKGETSYVEIGDDNLIREYVSIHRATGEGEKTIIGNGNMIMAYCHVGHNCIIGNKNIMANAVQLAGHVTIQDQVTIGGLSAIHQNCRIGRLSMLSGMAGVTQDVPPFFIYAKAPAFAVNLNRIGIKRSGISDDARNELYKAFKIVFESPLNRLNLAQKLEDDLEGFDEIKELIEFIRSSKRGIRVIREKFD